MMYDKDYEPNGYDYEDAQGAEWQIEQFETNVGKWILADENVYAIESVDRFLLDIKKLANKHAPALDIPQSVWLAINDGFGEAVEGGDKEVLKELVIQAFLEEFRALKGRLEVVLNAEADREDSEIRSDFFASCM